MAILNKIKNTLLGNPNDQYANSDKRLQEFDEALTEYQQGKSMLDERIVSNDKWYRLRHWEEMRKTGNETDPQPASAWLFNMLANKHADAMDNFPEPSVLPRAKDDKEVSKLLSEVLPTVLEQAGYDDVYSACMWDKPKLGTAVTSVLWDKSLLNGIGDIKISRCNILNMFWKPGVADIQDSPYLFYCALVDSKQLEQQYPQIKGHTGAGKMILKEFAYTDYMQVDNTKKTLVVDCYYKKFANGIMLLQYCKYANGIILYSSEDDKDEKGNYRYATKGFYNDNKYPFVFDTMFPEEGSPAGFGYIDICKDEQRDIDKLNQLILKNALAACRKRYVVKAGNGVNLDDFFDFTKEAISYTGNANDIREAIYELESKPIPSIYVNILNNKIDTLKETTGNRDVSQGGTTSGVTAASGIAAMQEAGSKQSRDANRGSYRAFTEICYMVIERIRQFYDIGRSYRIAGADGAEQYVSLDNSALKPQSIPGFGADPATRTPIFDIKVRAHKANPYSRIAQNSMAQEFYGAGFFRPDLSDQALACIEMMDFEGKDAVAERIAQNGTMFQEIQRLQQALAMMTGNIPPQQQGGQPTAGQPNSKTSTGEHPVVQNARERAAQAASPQ
jgi:hypothetical protein